MGVYVKRKCGKCGNTIENWTRSYRSIGSPLERCDRCGAMNKVDHITEWDLMSRGEKLSWILNVFTIIWSGFSGVIIVSIICKLINTEIPYKWFPVIILISVAVRYLFLIATINDSKKRMLDSEYRAFLRKYRVYEIKNFYKNTKTKHLFDGDIDGKGALFYCNGKIKYYGELKKGIRNGKGIEFTNDSNYKYKGYFLNGKYHGEGSLYDEEGNVILKGIFIEGAFDYNG